MVFGSLSNLFYSPPTDLPPELTARYMMRQAARSTLFAAKQISEQVGISDLNKTDSLPLVTSSKYTKRQMRGFNNVNR